MGRQYSKAGGTLKHATGLMKLKHMHMVMDFKANLKAQQAAYALEQLRARQTELMCELINLDLAWELWFDDNANVPAFGTIAERVTILERRVSALQIPAPLMELRREPLSVSRSGDVSPSFLQVTVISKVTVTQGSGQ
jgi:hypothetical protein